MLLPLREGLGEADGRLSPGAVSPACRAMARLSRLGIAGTAVYRACIGAVSTRQFLPVPVAERLDWQR
jgi:hypothetical protein